MTKNRLQSPIRRSAHRIEDRHCNIPGSRHEQQYPSPKITVKHNKAPNRIRFSVPLIKHHATLAEMLKQSILRDENATGVYHAEPSIVTGTLLIKYHPAFHTEEEVIHLLNEQVRKLTSGEMVPYEKHKTPKLGKMKPQAFFTRELVMSVCGNVLAGLVLATLVTA